MTIYPFRLEVGEWGMSLSSCFSYHHYILDYLYQWHLPLLRDLIFFFHCSPVCLFVIYLLILGNIVSWNRRFVVAIGVRGTANLVAISCSMERGIFAWSSWKVQRSSKILWHVSGREWFGGLLNQITIDGEATLKLLLVWQVIRVEEDTTLGCVADDNVALAWEIFRSLKFLLNMWFYFSQWVSSLERRELLVDRVVP